MRIKYKVWDKKDKVMYENISALNFDIEGNLESVTICDSLIKHKVSIDELELLQFTGEVDKDGVELYKGDLVEGCMFDGSYAVGKIVFEEGSFWVYPIGRFIEGVDYITCKHIKKIGNIFEN